MFSLRVLLQSTQHVKKVLNSSFTRSQLRPASKTTDSELLLHVIEKTLNLQSRRLDAVLKKTVNLRTTALEKSIAAGLVRVNEEVEYTKSRSVEAGDEIELWLAALPESPYLARVHHVEIVDYQLGEKNYQILCNVCKSMVVKNWK